MLSIAAWLSPERPLDGLPAGRLDVRPERFEAGRVRGDEIPVEQAVAAGADVRRVRLEHRLHHALSIAASPPTRMR